METKAKKAKKVTGLLIIANGMQDKADKLKSLNQYDHTETVSSSSRPFFIEFGGGCTHVKYFPKDNEIGDSITEFFVGLFSKIAATAWAEIDALIK